MDFALDEDVPDELAFWLSRAGHEARTSRQASLMGATDAAQILRAVQENRTLVTHNFRDYEILQFAWLQWWQELWPATTLPAPIHSGILVVPQMNRHRGYCLPEFVAEQINDLVSSGVSITNTLMRWQPAYGWVRWRLPGE